MAINLEQYKITPEQAQKKLSTGKTIDLNQYKTASMEPEQSILGGIGQTIGGVSKAIENTLVSPLWEVEKGIAKGIGSTAFGLGKLGTMIGRILLPESLEPKETIYEKEKPNILKPKNAMQQIGFTGEQLAEFLVPSGAIAKMEKGAGLLARSATEAITLGTTAAAQSGKIDNEAKTGAIIGAMFPPAGALLKTVGSKTIGKALEKLGSKIEDVVLKPTRADIEDGLKIANVYKYDLGGSLKQSAYKTEIALQRLGKQLKNIVEAVNAKVSLEGVYKKTAERLKTSKPAQFGDIGAIGNQLNKLENEVRELTKTGWLNFADAQLVKQGAGRKGAWTFGMADPEAKAIEKVYTTFYQEMKKELENVANKSGVAGLKETNKAISEIIPIQNAILRRLPVEQRNSIINLYENMGIYASMFDPKALAFVGTSRLLRNGRFANFLVRSAKNMKQPTSSIGERLFGGSASEMEVGAGLSMKNIAKNIHPEDKSRIIDFIDNVRLRGKENVQLEIDARRLAERFGINPNQGNSKLANQFDDLLSRIR